MVFQGSAGESSRTSGAGSGGGFDQLLARLDESLRRSALDDRSHYPEDLLASELSDDGTRTDTTADTSMDEARAEPDGQARLIDSVHQYLSTLPSSAVVDGTTIDALLRVVASCVDSPLAPARLAAVSELLARYTGQSVQTTGALAVANVAELLKDELDAAASRPVLSVAESDAELDNRRDDALAAAGDLPESDPPMTPMPAAAAAATTSTPADPSGAPPVATPAVASESSAVEVVPTSVPASTTPLAEAAEGSSAVSVATSGTASAGVSVPTSGTATPES
jgi:hypothetical protein